MNPACESFRGLLEESLASAGGLAALGVHEHAASCDACAGLLRSEQALNRLLARVPESRGPVDLGRRVLEGLGGERRKLPQCEPECEPGAGELDQMLECLPEPAIPAGLSTRVLAGLAAERSPALHPPRLHRGRRMPGPVLALAAALVALLGAWIWLGGRSPAQELEAPGGDLAELELDEELLLYAVERWELLQDDDLDIWLASLDPEDELLMEFADESEWADPTWREK